MAPGKAYVPMTHGPGRGNWGHAGRPGEVGGSGVGGEGSKVDQSSLFGDTTDKKDASQSAIEGKGIQDISEMTSRQADIALENYFGNKASTELNKYLNGKITPNKADIKEFDKTTKALDTLISKQKELPAGIELYRGVGIHDGEFLAKADIGTTFDANTKGFQSFSYDGEQALSFAKTWGSNDATVVRFITTGNEKGLHNLDESEILFGRGIPWKVVGQETISREWMSEGKKNWHIVTLTKG